MPKLSPVQHERAIGMLHANVTPSLVVKWFGCHVRTIERLRNRFLVTGTTTYRPRSGRPRVTTPCQDRYIRMPHLRSRFRPATVTARTTPGTHNARISGQTVRNHLRENGVRPRRPYVGHKLTLGHRRNRVQWARNHQRWNQLQWRQILFSGESRFCLERHNGRTLVNRRNERFASACVLARDQFGDRSVTVWAGIIC